MYRNLNGMRTMTRLPECVFVVDPRKEKNSIREAKKLGITTIALIEHDMGVVMDLSDRVVVMDYGKKIGDGTPSEVRSNQAVIDAYLGVAHD